MAFFPKLFRLTPRSVRSFLFQAEGGAVGPQGPAGPAGAAGVGVLNYTTAEQSTGRTWIDGKTIFQKTVVIAAGPNNSIVNVAHGIVGLDTVVDYKMMLRDGNTHIFVPDVEATAVIQLHHIFDATNIVLVSGMGGDWSGYSGACTLYYTKV
jgi:hypothetical protein